MGSYGETANPSANASPFTNITVSALIKFKLLNFAAVSYLSVPMILVNFSLFSSFGKVTLKLISSPFALPTLDITIPLFRPSSKK